MKKLINILRKSVRYSLPVFFGYIPLGFAFGIMLSDAGYNPVWAFFMALFIFAGTGQFLAVEFLAAGADIPQVVLLTFLINFRHFFYGLSMIPKYKGTGIRKLYLMFGLTDETYALLTTTKVPDDIKKEDFYFAITLLNHSYWIMGCVLGATVGSLVNISFKGIDFVMTALFAVLVVEQWKSHSNHFPALLGFCVPIIALLLIGPDNFLIPTLIVVSFVLLCLQGKLTERGDKLGR